MKATYPLILAAYVIDESFSPAHSGLRRMLRLMSDCQIAINCLTTSNLLLTSGDLGLFRALCLLWLRRESGVSSTKSVDLRAMKTRKYLEGGIEVSELGFGAWQLGVESGWKAVSEAEADRMIRTALDQGINFFDTAPNYGMGTSEARLGKVFKTIDRSKVVINSKFGRLDNGEVDFSAKHVRGSVERSLKRLNVDYLDSVIIHSPPTEFLDGNKNDHYAILERLQDEGKIKAYGASVDFEEEINLLMETTNAKVIQSFFNIFHQDCKRSFELLKSKGATVIAKIPFDSGWLTGKYGADSQFTGVRDRWSRRTFKPELDCWSG